MVVLSAVLTEDLVMVSVMASLFSVVYHQAVRAAVVLLSVSKSLDRIYSCRNRPRLRTNLLRPLHQGSFRGDVEKMIDYRLFRPFCPDVFPKIRRLDLL